MKVLHLPTSVGGHSWGLAQGEKILGLDSKVLVSRQNWLNYNCDICLHLEKKSKIKKLLIPLIEFFKIRDKFDVFHFNFGSSLIDYPQYGLNLLDLPFYKGVKIMTYNGCDARQKYPTIQRVGFSACHEVDCYDGLCNSWQQYDVKRKRIAKVEKNVDHIFALNPDLMYFLPEDKTSFLPYAIAGWYEIEESKYEIKDKIKIVHAPTNRACKGSKYIIKALKELQQRFSNVEISLIENVPYNEALKLYRESHIVVDQVLVGWYGGLAVEVMKMGKPVTVFIREEDLRFIPKKMAEDLSETIINTDPYNIFDKLAKYIDNIQLLYQKSEASREYVSKWHNPEYVASITKEAYERFL